MPSSVCRSVTGQLSRIGGGERVAEAVVTTKHRESAGQGVERGSTRMDGVIAGLAELVGNNLKCELGILVHFRLGVRDRIGADRSCVQTDESANENQSDDHRNHQLNQCDTDRSPAASPCA